MAVVTVAAVAVCNWCVSFPTFDDLARERHTSSCRDDSAAAVQLQRFKWCCSSVVECIDDQHQACVAVVTCSSSPAFDELEYLDEHHLSDNIIRSLSAAG